MSPREVDNIKAAVREEMEQRLNNTSQSKKMQWRLGRRGAFLASMGLLYMFLGYSYGFTDIPAFTYTQLAMPLMIIPSLHVWGALWMATGIAALINAWWPPGRDGGGFIALEALSTVWGILNLFGGIFLDAPRALSLAWIFVVFSISILIVSGMPDPSPLSKIAARDDADDVE